MFSSRLWRSIIVACVTVAVLLVIVHAWHQSRDPADGGLRIVAVENPQILYDGDERARSGHNESAILAHGDADSNNANNNNKNRKPSSRTSRKDSKNPTRRTRAAPVKAVTTPDVDGVANEPWRGAEGSDDGTLSHQPPHRCLHHNPDFIKHVYASTEEASVLDVNPSAKSTPSTADNASSVAPKANKPRRGAGVNASASTPPRRFVPPPPSRFRPVRVRVDVSNLYHTDSFCGAVGDVRDDFIGGKVQCTSDDILTSVKRQYILRVVIPEIVDRVERMLQVATITPDVAAAYTAYTETGEAVDKSDDDAPPVTVPSGAAGQSSHTRLIVPRKPCSRDGIYIPPEHGRDGVEDADLVIYALAGPVRDVASAGASPSTTVAWSSYCAVDLYGRPTVAHLNFVPSSIQPSRTTALRRLNLPVAMAADSDNRIITVVDPFGGSFTGATAAHKTGGTSPSSSSSSFSSLLSHTGNSRFSVCPVQLSSTASATATSSSVLPAALSGDGDQWWTLKYIRTMMHEMFHILGFAPPLLTEYALKTVHRGESVTMVSEAGPVRAARAFFACPSLEGVELEDEGGDGTALGHWERLWLRDDIMSGVPSTTAAMSGVTLAFLDSLPFYRVNVDYAEPMPWGAGAGCDFLERQCKPLASHAGLVRLATSTYNQSDAVVDNDDASTSRGVDEQRRGARQSKALDDEDDRDGRAANATTTTTTAAADVSTTSAPPSTSSSTTTEAPTSTTKAPTAATTTTTTTTATPTSSTSTTQAPTTSTTTTTTTTSTTEPSTTTTTTTPEPTTSTSTTTTSTTATPKAPKTTTTTTTSTTTTTEAPTTSTTTTTTEAPVIAEPASRESLLARAKYWCEDKGLTSHRVPQCTYDRRSIGICNVDFKPLKSGGIGERKSPAGDSMPEPVDDDDDSDHDDSADLGASDSGATDSDPDNRTASSSSSSSSSSGKNKRHAATGRSLLMNGCPVVEPYLNRWCTNGLLSIDLAPDAEQDALVHSQGYYFGPQSRCARVDAFTRRTSSAPSPAHASEAQWVNGTNTSTVDTADDTGSYVSSVRTRADVREMTDARCLRMRCVPRDALVLATATRPRTAARAEGYRLEMEVGGLWLACPEDGRSGYIELPGETGFSGTLACEEAELLCTAELTQDNGNTLVTAPDTTSADRPNRTAPISALSAWSVPSQGLAEYAVPVRLLLSLTVPPTGPTNLAHTRASASTSSTKAATSKEKGKKETRASTKSDAKPSSATTAPSTAAAEAVDSLLLLSAWRLVAEQCPVAFEVALQHDLDDLLTTARSPTSTTRGPAFPSLSTFVKQREGAARLFPPFTLSLWKGTPMDTRAASPSSSSGMHQARDTKKRKKEGNTSSSGSTSPLYDPVAGSWLRAHTGSDAAPPILLHVGFYLAVTTAQPEKLARHTLDLASLAWRANSSLPRVQALLASAYHTLKDGGPRHVLCSAQWEVPLPGVFAQVFAAPHTLDMVTPRSQLWADAVVAPARTATGQLLPVPLDGPMLPPSDLFAVAQIDLALSTILPPGRARASMLSHPLMLEALRRDVSALLGVTRNLVGIENVMWGEEVARQRTHRFRDDLADPHQLLDMLRSAFKGGSSRAASRTLSAGEQVLGTFTAVVYAHPLPETLRFSLASNRTSTTPVARTVRVHTDAVRGAPDLPAYTRAYWTDVLHFAASDRVPLRVAGDALVELLYGTAPAAPSFLFSSTSPAAKARDEEGRLSSQDLSTLGAYDELQMFRQRAQDSATSSSSSSSSATAALDDALRKQLEAMRRTLNTGDVWVSAVLAVRDGSPSDLPSVCHASLADSLLEKSSSVSLLSLMTPSWLRGEPSCRRWRLHGGMSWCVSVYEGRTCGDADTVDDAVRSFCVNIRTVWFTLAILSAVILLVWVYGLALCCWRFCCCCCCPEPPVKDDFYD